MADPIAGPSERPTSKGSEYGVESRQTVWDRFGFRRLGFWFGKEGQHDDGDGDDDHHHHHHHRDARDFMSDHDAQGIEGTSPPSPHGRNRRRSRKVVPGLPRPGTFKRQNSERRERLLPVEPHLIERRSASADRRRARSAHRSSSVPPADVPPSSPPADENDTTTVPLDNSTANRPGDEVEKSPVSEVVEVDPGCEDHEGLHIQPEATPQAQASPSSPILSETRLDPHAPPIQSGVGESSSPPQQHDDRLADSQFDELIATELEERWILNLSMHFRDRSDREKFFVTYAETPTKWRRLTVSCDYRHAPENSLESDLKALRYQRDKSARIYESIRESLPDIEFYDTVTNLKLQTSDDRLHVHVTEDVNEIIQFPPLSAVAHLKCEKFPESSIRFDSHLSGFVYKVAVDGRVLIKKELPGPDTVDEFLYEINALDALTGSQSVINFGGIVVDDLHQCVKGLLISLADQGALVDLIYDLKGHIPWRRRERWARQIVQGLSEIHEGGFVQGDFTLSNIVIDGEDNAKIIDINRRGCPIGWEPPELSALIKSGQRISMYIGVKSDLFQLGMVLWALATEDDEPERHARPLVFEHADDIPSYYRELVSLCLSDSPRDRVSAKDLLRIFPSSSGRDSDPPRRIVRRTSFPELLDQKEAMSLANKEDRDIENAVSFAPTSYGNEEGFPRAESYERHSVGNRSPGYCHDGYSDSLSSWDDGHRRGRSPGGNVSHVDHDINSTSGCSKNEAGEEAQIISISPSDEKQWEEVDIGGHPYLIRRDTFKAATTNLNEHGEDGPNLPPAEDLEKTEVSEGLEAEKTRDLDISVGHSDIEPAEPNRKGDKCLERNEIDSQEKASLADHDGGLECMPAEGAPKAISAMGEHASGVEDDTFSALPKAPAEQRSDHSERVADSLTDATAEPLDVRQVPLPSQTGTEDDTLVASIDLNERTQVGQGEYASQRGDDTVHKVPSKDRLPQQETIRSRTDQSGKPALSDQHSTATGLLETSVGSECTKYIPPSGLDSKTGPSQTLYSTSNGPLATPHIEDTPGAWPETPADTFDSRPLAPQSTQESVPPSSLPVKTPIIPNQTDPAFNEDPKTTAANVSSTSGPPPIPDYKPVPETQVVDTTSSSAAAAAAAAACPLASENSPPPKQPPAELSQQSHAISAGPLTGDLAGIGSHACRLDV